MGRKGNFRTFCLISTPTALDQVEMYRDMTVHEGWRGGTGGLFRFHSNDKILKTKLMIKKISIY